MITLWLILIGIVFSTGVLFIAWRFLSHRHALPCPSWLSWLVERDNPFSRINQAKTIIAHLDLKEGMQVLDVGCGPGRLAIPLAHAVGSKGSVVALDMQEGMLKKTAKKAHDAGLTNITLRKAEIGKQELEHNAFDRILLVTVLGEIVDKKAAFQELYNALKPGGILSITEIIFDPHYQRRDNVIAFGDEIGFKKKDLFEDWFAYTLNVEKPITQ